VLKTLLSSCYDETIISSQGNSSFITVCIDPLFLRSSLTNGFVNESDYPTYPPPGYDFNTERIHPNRKYPYEVTTYPPNYWHPDCILPLIRDLSNVSTQFRAELGKVFWSSVRICCPNKYSAMALKPFLLDRPATHKGIKRLSVEIVEVEEGESDGKYLLPAYKCIADSKFELEVLELRLAIHENILLELLKGRGQAAWLEVFRNICVTKTLDLKIEWHSDYEDYYTENTPDWEVEMKMRQEWIKELGNLLYEVLQPISLRPVPITTDQEKYLRDRAALNTTGIKSQLS
jgi:hypothetical protein